MPNEGATEDGRGRLAFFFSNALVKKVVISGEPKVKEVDPINYQEELTMIRKNLSDSGRRIRFVSSPATSWEMGNRLNKGCQMLHFTGHGCKEMLGFEADDCGVSEPFTANKLKELFKAAGQIEAGRPELVFFGSCSSEAHGNALAEAGVPHVVAVKSGKKVEDEKARIFSSTFYHALIAGNYTVKKAFENAVIAVKKRAFDVDVSAVTNEDPKTAEDFLLLPENGDHDIKMFDDLPKGMFKDETPRLPMAHRLPCARKTYFGAVGLQHAISLLQNPDAACVSIVGEAEIGKTERALQAVHYIRERHIFNAIFFAEFKQVISQRPSPPTQGSRSEVERFFKESFCKLIAMALGWDKESNTSAKQLWGSMLRCAIDEMGQQPFKILLILDGVDALYEDRGEEARTSLVKILDDLCRISPRLKLLLTCKEQLLKGTDERLSNTKELVHEVLPLQGEDSAKLLWHLSPRDGGCGLFFEDIDATIDYSHEDVVKGIQKLKLMEIVNGHPGTLRHLGPLLHSFLMKDSSMVACAERYRAQLNKRREPFSEIIASNIASEAGLKDFNCKLVWVGATARAEAEGRSIKGLEDGAQYRSVLWRYLSLGLENWLCRLQTTGDNEEQLEDNNLSMWNEGSGRTFSSGSCYYSGAGWGARGQDMGHGYISTQKPRKLSKEELKFVRHVLWSCKPRQTTQKKETGHRNEAGGVTKAGKAKEKGHVRSVSDEVNEVVTLEKFVNFCNRWWIPVMTTLSRIPKEWTPMNPMKVRGFVSRLEAECLVGSIGQPGVFLLRFSESRPGLLILTFSSEVMNSDAGIFIQHSLVTVQSDGRWTLHYNHDTRHGITYPSLRDLVLDKVILKTLYPRVEKRRAFEI